jgi:hypothetical protein
MKGFYNIFQKQLALSDGLPLPFHKDLDGHVHGDDQPPQRVSIEQCERDMKQKPFRKRTIDPRP